MMSQVMIKMRLNIVSLYVYSKFLFARKRFTVNRESPLTHIQTNGEIPQLIPTEHCYIPRENDYKMSSPADYTL